MGWYLRHDAHSRHPRQRVPHFLGDGGRCSAYGLQRLRCSSLHQVRRRMRRRGSLCSLVGVGTHNGSQRHRFGGLEPIVHESGKCRERTQFVDIDRQKQLCVRMKTLTPLPSTCLPEFIAEGQAEVADDVFVGTKSEPVVEVTERVPITTTCMCSIFQVSFFLTDFKGEDLRLWFEPKKGVNRMLVPPGS